MLPPDISWDRYPITLRVPHLCEIYGGLKPDTLRRAILRGDPSLPLPFMDRPWRWRKAEVQRHYNRLTLRDVRNARATLRREMREAV